MKFPESKFSKNKEQINKFKSINNDLSVPVELSGKSPNIIRSTK